MRKQMRKKPIFLDIENETRYFYMAAEENNYKKTKGRRIFFRTSPLQSRKEAVRLAMVASVEMEDACYMTFIEETSGFVIMDSFLVLEADLDWEWFIPEVASRTARALIESTGGSFSGLVEAIEGTREEIRWDYGPLPADHGKPVNPIIYMR